MARRKRSVFGSLVSFPSVGGITEYNPLGKQVNSTDLFVGAAIGMAGGVMVKKGLYFAIDKLNMSPTNPVVNFVDQYSGPISSILAGVAAYMVQRKTNKGRATGHLIGAALVGVAPIGWTLLAKSGFAGLVDVNYGLLTDEAMNGMIVDDPGMNGLAAYSMADDVDILDAA